MSQVRKDPVIAIDGPAGVGKSTAARRIAQEFGWLYLDTGAMYRAVTYAWHCAGQPQDGFSNPAWLATLEINFSSDATLLMQGEPLNHELRTPEVTADVSRVSADKAVRNYCTKRQREIGSERPSILDGRDIGTVVFPNAFLKVFLVASDEIRARRRWLEQGGQNAPMSLKKVHQDLIERDRKDASRTIAPLKKADDAVEVNTDHQSVDTVIQTIKSLANKYASAANIQLNT